VNLWESILVALEGIRTNKLRSGLTMLGIVIGIAAVIAVVAIGQGGRAVLVTEMEKFGTNIFGVYVDWRSDKPATKRDFAMEDVELIKTLVPAIRGMSPSQDNIATVKATKKGKMARVQGSNGDYARMHDIRLIKGRFFSNADAKAERKVVVLEDKLAEGIFGKSNPLGQRVTINNIQVTVIGLVKSNTSFLMGGFNTAYLPFGSGRRLSTRM